MDTNSPAGYPGHIDSHQHFWRYDPLRHNWITDDMAIIRKDFLPEDLQPWLIQNGVEGCIAVQAEQTEEETRFLLDLAESHSFIKAVVGWTDLCAIDAEERLAYFQPFTKLRGFREILQGESPAYLLRPEFLRGISLLNKYGFTYDILIYPQHLKAATQLVKENPHQLFVIDHIAKPFIKAGLIGEWKKDMIEIAQYPNVHCKLSGMVTEAHHRRWKEADLEPYIDTVVEAFGINRLMYGSDWPVCLVAAEYSRMIGVVENYFSAFSIGEKQKIFRENALSFYSIRI